MSSKNVVDHLYMKKYPFFKINENDNVTINAPTGKAEIYLPKGYFETGISEELGNRIQTLAIFIFKYYPDYNSKRCSTYQFNLPEAIVFSFTDSEEKILNMENVLKDPEIIDEEDDSKDEKYRIFTLYDGDSFIESMEVVKTFKNTEKLIRLHHGGKLPDQINYSDIIKVYLENMLTNDCDLKVPASILEFMIAELARCNENHEIPFRKKIGLDKNNNEKDFYSISIKDLAMIVSTFTGITSENISKALTYAISKTRLDGTESYTPVEETLKY